MNNDVLDRLIRFMVVVSLVFATGCGIHHLRRNAPGKLARDSEVVRAAAVGERVRPDDPGEHVLELLTGPTVEFGGRLDAPSPTFQQAIRLGGELSLHYFSLDESHSYTEPFLIPDIWADFRAIREARNEQSETTPVPRANLGAAYDFARSDVAVYLEAGAAFPGHIGLTAGYSTEPSAGNHGLQATLTLYGFVRLRYARYFTDRHELFLGFSPRAFHTLVWSQ